MKLDSLTPVPGSTKNRKRVGRGAGAWTWLADSPSHGFRCLGRAAQLSDGHRAGGMALPERFSAVAPDQQKP